MIKFEPQTAELDAQFKQLTTPGSATMMRALDAFARVLRTRIQLAFRQATSPSGTAWKPLNTFFRSGQPLRNTGRLYGSIQARRDGDGVIVGTNLRTPGGSHNLGAIHQFGAVVLPKKGNLLGPIPVGNKGFAFLRKAVIPARPFMPLDKAGAVLLPAAWEKTALASMTRALGLGT